MTFLQLFLVNESLEPENDQFVLASSTAAKKRGQRVFLATAFLLCIEDTITLRYAKLTVPLISDLVEMC